MYVFYMYVFGLKHTYGINRIETLACKHEQNKLRILLNLCRKEINGTNFPIVS